MKIEIEINGRTSLVRSEGFKETMKTTWLLKQFKLNDLYQYINDKKK